jgi:methyltransferase (TIGR00027 family)
MKELALATVFEVDHPDSQGEKRKRVPALWQAAREVRFVAVDFTRDDLDQALAAAGHDAGQPTTWIWEGVVMYLTRQEIETTLAVIKHRSLAKSRVIIAYHAPALMLLFVGLLVRRLGEPLRSAARASRL